MIAIYLVIGVYYLSLLFICILYSCQFLMYVFFYLTHLCVDRGGYLF